MRVAILLVCALVASGCKGSGARLEGKWRGDKAQGVPPRAQTAADGFASGVELEFKGDQVTVIRAGERGQGKFRVVKDEPAAIVISTDNPPATFTFAVVNDHTLKWAIAGEQSITLQRQ